MPERHLSAPKRKQQVSDLLYFQIIFVFLRDTAVSAFNSFGFIRVCAAEPRSDFRYRSNANDGKAMLCRVLPRGLAPKRKQQVSNLLFSFWSGKRDSNSRHLPWQGNALPLSHSRKSSMSNISKVKLFVNCFLRYFLKSLRIT